jgi:hypothetical protein
MSYGVEIVAGGVKYNFNVDTIKQVRELFTGSRYVTEFKVTEEKHNRAGAILEYRTMDEQEVQDIIWGRAA